MTNAKSKIKSGGIALPLDLQERLAADALRIPRGSKSELGRDLIIFAYRIIDQFNLSPKDISDELHDSDSSGGRRLEKPSLEFGHALSEFKRTNNYDTLTAIYRSSLGGLRTIRNFGYYDHWADEVKAESEVEEKRRA